jgi:hypothetical protein
MTLHISYEHKCQRCGSDYIPFDADVPCPKCGLVESERYDLVGTAVESTLYNLKRYGSYKPWAWRESTFGDRILLRLFHVLQADHDAGGVPPFEERVDTWVNTVMDWGDAAYLAPYFSRVCLRVYGELQAQPERVAELWAKAEANKKASGQSPV